MRSMSALLAAMGVAAALAAAGMPASAAVIPVANSSFESPILGPGDNGGVYNSGPIAGWWQGPTGPSGVFNPLVSGAGYVGGSAYSSVPDGNQIAWTNNTYIAQLIGAVTPGMSYTLSVLVGQRADGLGIGQFDLALGTVTDGTPASYFEFAVAENPPLITPAPGGFVLVSLTGTAPGNATGDLVISFSSGPGQANWDMVSLTSAVPEPATWALMLLGFAAVSLFAYRRTRKTSVLAAKGI